MTNVAILDAGSDKVYGLRRTIEELEKRDANVITFDPREVSIKVADSKVQLKYKELDLLTETDVCLIRRTRDAVAEALELITLFTYKNIRCVDPLEAFISPLSKTMTIAKATSNVPVPESIIINSVNCLKNLDWNVFPAIVKPLLGFKGKDVTMAENEGEMLKQVEELLGRGERVLIQKYLKIVNEYRVTIVGEKAVAVCLKKTTRKNALLRNFAQGATMHLVEMPDIAQLALDVAMSKNVLIAGVDLIQTEEGIFLLECNRCPGFEGVERCGINIAEEIVTYLIDY